MASVSIYLNFARETEQAFNFYKSVFGGELGQIMRFSDMPLQEGMSPLPKEDQNLIMHTDLTITGGHILMGSDAPKSMGFKINIGNNMHINLQIDTRKEADQLFKNLSEEGEVTMPMEDQFWGDYFGSCTDKFGVQWMINCPEKA
ncbi:MAG: VOC family protein [Bacteroidota bacterium]